ncbi:MAG: hypothetical protein K2M55_07725, partial [Muribaculaceae bacterium]|nr:hypothetical protein [Muribaculaceae bacterium]
MNTNHEELWTSCRRFLQDNMEPQQFDTWFRDMKSVSFEDSELKLLVPS